MLAHPRRLQRHIRLLASPPATDPTPDAELLRRFVRTRDQDAFAALVARHGGLVLGVCSRRLRDADAAEDAFQAVWLVLARQAARIRPAASLAAWLYGVARRVAQNALRGDARRRRREAEGARAALSARQSDPLEQLTARELVRALDEEVERLPEGYRLPVLLVCLEGLSQEEAAARLGWTAGQVKGRLERGRKRLHERLAQRGLTLPAALAAVQLSRAEAPAVLVAAAVRAAVAFAFGEPADAGGASTEAMGLARGALPATAWGTAKLWAGLALALGVAALGGVGLAWPRPQEPPPVAAAPAPAGAHSGAPLPEQPRTDAHGDPLPAGAVARMGRRKAPKVQPVLCLAVAPDGRTVASGYATSAAILLWELRTGKELRALQGHRAGITTLAFSPDSTTLASGSSDHYRPDEEGPVRLWSLPAGGERRLPTRQFRQSVFGVAFSPDGKTLATVGDPLTRGLGHDATRLWDWGALQEVRQFGGQAALRSVTFSAQGTVATADFDRGLSVWSAATGERLRQLRRETGGVLSLTFSPVGETLAWSENRVRLSEGETKLSGGVTPRIVRRLHVPSGEMLPDLEEPHAPLGSARFELGGRRDFTGPLAFSPDGRLLATGDWLNPNAVRLWELASGKERATFLGHEGAVRGVAFSADGRWVVSGSADGTLLVWDATAGTAGGPPPGGLSGKALEALWADLAAGDGARAGRAIGALARAPGEAVPFLRGRLRPVAVVGKEVVPLRIAELGAGKFAVRERAARELAGFGDAVEGPLRQALAASPPLEVRRRLEGLLAGLDPRRSPERLRWLRAVEALERAGGAEARAVLAWLAGGAPGDRLTREARAAQGRLARR